MHPIGPLSFLWGVVWRGKGGLGGSVRGFVNLFYCIGLVWFMGAWQTLLLSCHFFFFVFISLKVLSKKKAFVRGNVKEN